MCIDGALIPVNNTSVTVEDFARQKESEKFSDLVKNDLENAGYEVERGTYLYMNSGARFDDDNGYYLVVEVDSNGKQSGISNIVDVRKVASRLPYYVSEKIEKKIVNIEDTPTYVGVEMVDGSTEQMLINYHGAKVTKLEDGDFIVDAHICNTKFDSFRMKFSGMSYEQFLEETSAITERQDQLNKSGGCMNSDAPVPNAPSNNRDEKNEELDEIKKQLELILPDLTVPTISVAEDSTDSENDVPEEIQESDEPDDNWNLGNDNPEAEAPESEEPEDNWSPENDESTVDTPESEVPEDSKVSDNISTDVKGQLSEQDVVAYEIFCEILADVERKLEGIEGIDSILYATNDLEAWIAYCLIAQEPCIPVPTCVFPEAVNIDYVYTLYYEAYRQNPTSGMLSLKGYNYDYQLLGVKYCEELDTRLDKTREEIGKAKEVANSITTSSMSDADKVMAINEYLCENASYDYDSCNCDVDFDNQLDVFDLVILKKIATLQFSADNEKIRTAADVNGDNEVNIADAVTMQSYLLKKIDRFPL